MNKKDSNDQLQPISILRRVVDMSEINAKKNNNAHAKGAKKQTAALHRKKTDNSPSVNTSDLTSKDAAKQPANRPQNIRKVQKTVKNVILPAEQAATPQTASGEDSKTRTKRISTERGALFQAKTTRLVAPAAPPTAASQNAPSSVRIDNTANAAADTSSEKTQKQRKLVQKTHQTHQKKNIKFEHKTPRFAKDDIKTKPQPKRQHLDLAQHQQIVQDHITDSLLLQSWRSKQWGASIATFGQAFSSMLSKCMPLVQARFVNNMCIAPGRLEATVINDVTSIEIKQFTPGQWKVVSNLLSDRAIFTTSLLNGELPEGILDIFKQASLSLFPSKSQEFSYTCTCGCNPETSPCEHVCALLLAFTQALEEDPFNIFTLRGMTIQDLLSQLRNARSDQVVNEKTRCKINYEMPAQSVDYNDFFTPKGNLNEIAFRIAYTPNTLIKRLGSPSTWTAPFQLEDIISPIIENAAKRAEIIGISDKYQIDDESSETDFNDDLQAASSRAPKKTARSPKFVMPDLGFINTALSQEILDTVEGDPVSTAEDIIRWLKTKGATDIRTLARRTRLHKPTIEAFLNALCNAGLTRPDGENEKLKFETVF